MIKSRLVFSLLIFSLLVSSLLFFTVACKQGDHNEAPPISADDPQIKQKAKSLLDVRCGACHGPNSPGLGGINYILDTEKLISFGQVVSGLPSSSNLFLSVEDNSMPPDVPLTDSEKELVSAWIVALGNSGDRVYYSEVKTDIFNSKCLGCHSVAGGEKGGVNLETYEEAIKTVWVGFPEGSLIYDSVNSNRMPKDPNPKLSDSEIEMIYTWIQSGALEAP